MMRQRLLMLAVALGVCLLPRCLLADTVVGGQAPTNTDVSWAYTVTSAAATTKQKVSGSYTHWSVQLQKNEAGAIVTQVRVYLNGQTISTVAGHLTTDGDLYQFDGPISAFDLNTTTCTSCDARIVVTATR